MNEILQLKGSFNQKDASRKPGPSNIPKDRYVSLEHLKKLQMDLKNINNFWDKQKVKINPLVSAYFTDVVAKSNRIKAILESNIEKNNAAIVGAKFSKDVKKKHIITYCISKDHLNSSIINLQHIIDIMQSEFGERITNDDIESINNKSNKKLFLNNKKENGISRSKFVNVIVDSYYLEGFGIEQDISEFQNNAIVTLYDTGVKTSEIMKQLKINFLDIRSIDETTILLNPDQYNELKLKAPYLISMAVSDISKIEKEDIFSDVDFQISIPEPNNEPTIGVIDTMFDDNVYFSDWVEFHNMIDDNLQLDPEDYNHGTMVSSIIVDGSNINPKLDDGCGRFKVRHFGVAKAGYFSSFSVLRSIKEIIEKNKDIKVWNLSLGSSLEINDNFISPEAAILDKIQYENDVIFVVSGTNKSNNSNIKKIGAPADSINSLVVNSVSFDGNPTDYSREGTVLSFFNKPDVCYYGGDKENKIRVCSPLGEKFVCGTSFAAPWIARKMSYLIDILGLTREVAKALIIDSSAGWEDKKYSSNLLGYGVVPININDIIKTPTDEIKFVINGISEKYDTYSYNIPIPESNGKQPFISKATLCYFPKCSRNQGVDYTNTELDVHFGRITKLKNEKFKVDAINDNEQSEDLQLSLYEGTARKLYRKWDNVKHIRESLRTKKGNIKRPKSKKETPLWGISVKTKERLNTKDGSNLKFGMVITLKEISGENRIQDFIQQCQFRGWYVKEINVQNKIDIYNKAEEEIIFE